MSNLHFRRRLDSELANIEFTARNRQKVLERAKQGRSDKTWPGKVRGFLEIELRIPVKPVVVALVISISGLVYSCIGAARVSAEEMQKSSITVVNGDHGGQPDGLYKN